MIHCRLFASNTQPVFTKCAACTAAAAAGLGPRPPGAGLPRRGWEGKGPGRGERSGAPGRTQRPEGRTRRGAGPLGRRGPAARPPRAGGRRLPGRRGRAVCRKHRRRRRQRRMEAEPERAEALRRGGVAGVSGPGPRRRPLCRPRRELAVNGGGAPAGRLRAGPRSLRAGAPGGLNPRASGTNAAAGSLGAGRGDGSPHRTAAEAGKRCRPSSGEA